MVSIRAGTRQLTLLLVPLYELRLVLLPGAAVGLWAGLMQD